MLVACCRQRPLVPPGVKLDGKAQMSELTRFRVVRSVQDGRPPPSTTYRPLDAKQARTPFLRRAAELAGDPTPEGWGALRKLAIDVTGRPDPLDVLDESELPPDDDPGTGTGGALRALRDLDDWLLNAAEPPDPAGLRSGVEAVVIAAGVPADELAQAPTWVDAKARLLDLLAATMLLAQPAPEERDGQQLLDRVERAGHASRRLLVAGLVEGSATASADAPDPAPSPGHAVRVVDDRTLVLPDEVAWLLARVPWRGGRSALARRPGFADLYVVRSEWSCYLAGEIAHVENVLRGERKERVHVRLDETESTRVEESATRSVEERDTQSTDRATLESESARQTDLRLAIDASVDTTGQYGPTRLSTHVAGSFAYSVQDSRRLATTEAHEIVDRAVKRVEQDVRSSRTTRTLSRITETNTHALDATGEAEHIIGVYRWVDRIERVQVFRHPHRYLIELQIPEPAAYLLWARRHAPPKDGRPAPPVPFTVDGRPLAVTDITETGYAELAARYGAADIPPPPAAETTVSAALVLEVEQPNYQGVGEDNLTLRAPTAVGKAVEVALPDGYAAVEATVVATAAPALARWADVDDVGPFSGGSDNRYAPRWGYHYPRIDVVVADSLVQLEDETRPTVQHNPAVPFRKGWLALNAKRTQLPHVSGKLTIAATASGTYRAAVSVAVRATVTAEARARWAAEAFTLIRAAYDEQQRAVEEALPDPSGPRLGAPPGGNARVVHDELKRLAVTLLLGEPFDGFTTLTGDRDRAGPRLNPAAVAAAAPYVQFLEQAFEWENLSYVCYPYFWGARPGWPAATARDGEDSAFDAFLRAGSVRVVLPARPGFEPAVTTFLNFGILWGGAPAPTPDSPHYLSVADEIRALQRGPRDGEPGESWETRLPTTLVWLDREAALPSVNPRRRLTAPPDAVCPG